MLENVRCLICQLPVLLAKSESSKSRLGLKQSANRHLMSKIHFLITTTSRGRNTRSSITRETDRYGFEG